MSDSIDIREFHWLLTITQSIDVGVAVLDREFRVQVWNTFMENRSGVAPDQAANVSFFQLFPEVDKAWLTRKFESVLTLGTPAFTIWEQRPYLVRFDSYQPITGQQDFMYQNTTIFPLRATDGQYSHLCVVIYDVTEVATNSKQLHDANAELQKLSSTDRLTSLYNRGAWEETLRVEFARHCRYGSMASLVMFDIDHFKKVNDTYGHQAGDKVIQSVADAVRDHIRDADVAGRYGGEEFGVILPDTDKQGAKAFAERLRRAVEAREVMHEGVAIRCTISLGIADLNDDLNDHKGLIEHADQALYASKKGGRNQVTIYQA